MNRIHTGLLLLSMIALGACRNHETMTGSYGTGVVTGRALVVAGASASPAGVRVSVVGTGMSTLLGEDGGFTFAGVPENGTLRFTREDGIDVSMDVPASTQAFTVRLQPTGVTNSRRRAAPGPLLQFEGLVQTATLTSLSMSSSQAGDVTLVITPDTRIRKGNVPVVATDLKAGDRVHASASVKDGVKTAVEIIVQNPASTDDSGSDPSATMTANGVITVASASEITVSTVPHGDVVVKIVDGKTIIRKQGAVITGADLHVGDEVNCMGTRIDDHSLTAIQIEVRGHGNGNGNGNGHH